MAKPKHPKKTKEERLDAQPKVEHPDDRKDTKDVKPLRRFG